MFAQNFQVGSMALGCLGELGAGQACSERGFDQARRARITSNLAAGSLTSTLGKSASGTGIGSKFRPTAP